MELDNRFESFASDMAHTALENEIGKIGDLAKAILKGSNITVEETLNKLAADSGTTIFLRHVYTLKKSLSEKSHT